MDRDDPPSHRLIALLAAALGALALLLGAWTGGALSTSAAAFAESTPDEAALGEAVAEHRSQRAERRSRRLRSAWRRSLDLRFPLLRAGRVLRPAPSMWRTTPLRGPPGLLITA